MLIVKNVAVIAAGNQNGGIWWIGWIFLQNLLDFPQNLLDSNNLFSVQFSSFLPLFGRPIKFQALGVLKRKPNILFDNLTLF